MIQSGSSAAARVACCLPRVKCWVVTGTPVSHDCTDLYGLLHFLRIDPIYANIKLWNQLLNSNNAGDYIAGLFGPYVLIKSVLTLG